MTFPYFPIKNKNWRAPNDVGTFEGRCRTPGFQIAFLLFSYFPVLYSIQSEINFKHISPGLMNRLRNCRNIQQIH